MNQAEQSQLANVSDGVFAREMWRYNERGNVEAAKYVREQWKCSKESNGYGEKVGPLTVHEIKALAKKANGDLNDFARAVERAALIKAYTLLPELRQAEEAKHHRRYYRDGVNWGLITYSGAIRALVMGRAQGEIEDEIPAKPVEPRLGKELTKMENESQAEYLRPKFEVYAGKRQFDLRRENGSYTNLVTAYLWMGWLAHAAEGEFK